MMDRKFIFLLVGSVIGIILAVFGFSQFGFDLPLSPAEKGILLFHHEKIKLGGRDFSPVSMVKSPVDQGMVGKSVYPPVKLSDIAPPEQRQVSLVVIKGDKRIAIIDNLVVREGDTVNEGRVARIERNGVLVKNKEGERWLKIN